MWSICRIEFFFTTPNSTRMPSAEYRFSVLPVAHSESSANGTDSGSESRIVSGWTRLSNCDARIMYMNTTDSRNAQHELAERALQLAAAARARVVV